MQQQLNKVIWVLKEVFLDFFFVSKNLIGHYL